MNPTLDLIEEVWGGHDDFEQGGFEYVAFIIAEDLRDMRRAEWDEEECVEELADVIINAMRMLDEQGYYPRKQVLARLVDHEMRGTDTLVEKYQRLYDENQTDLSQF